MIKPSIIHHLDNFVRKNAQLLPAGSLFSLLCTVRIVEVGSFLAKNSRPRRTEDRQWALKDSLEGVEAVGV